MLNRLQSEYDEILEKTTKLRSFIDETEAYEYLSLTHQNLLNMQYDGMNDYLAILGIRITLLECEETK